MRAPVITEAETHPALQDGLTYFDKFNVEIKRLPGERVIGIHRDRLIGNFCDDQLHELAVRALRLQLHTDFGLHFFRQLIARHILNQLLVPGAVRIVGVNFDGLAFADGHALDGTFKARDDAAFADGKLQWILSFGTIKLDTVIQFARVVDTNSVA